MEGRIQILGKRGRTGIRHPPGPTIRLHHVISGQLFPKRFPFDSLAFGLHIAREFGDIAHYRVGPLHIYQLNHPDLVRQILVEHAEKFHKPRLMKRALRLLAGRGLLTSDGALWKRQRKLVQPAFNHDQVAAYGTDMAMEALRHMESIDNGTVIEVSAEMSKITLNVVVKALFGADVAKGADEVGRLMPIVLDVANQRLNSPLQLPAWLPTRRNRRESSAVAALDHVLQSLITQRRACTVRLNDLLSLLIGATDEDTGTMSDRQLRDELMTLFLAGHETTAMALTWTWYLLAIYPDVEARLLQELNGVLGSRIPMADDLRDLRYTEMVIREALRLYPPAPAFAREPIENVTIGDYVLPKGSLVVVNTYALHRDPRFFDTPESFNPDRFSDGWRDQIPRYAYLPFGAGPRVCIGNGFAMTEARLILATLAQRWRFSLEPDQDVVPVQLVTVRPKGGIRMKLHARHCIDAPSPA